MEVSFGKYSLQTRNNGEKTQIFDIVRAKWIVLTPEEQVRQIWIHYLIFDLNYSHTKIAIEKSLKINDRVKRFDICIYNNELKPFILIECKAPNIILKLPSIEQLSIYNIELNATKFIITNGINHYGYELKNGNIIQLKSLNSF
jgi:hypothetical protein